MSYVKVDSLDRLPPGQMKGYTVEGRKILVANVDDSFYAMDNTCPHMGGVLSEGKLEGSHVVCPKHGSIFDVTSGKAVQDGKMFFIKAKVHDLKGYQVKIEGDAIFIEVE